MSGTVICGESWAARPGVGRAARATGLLTLTCLALGVGAGETRAQTIETVAGTGEWRLGAFSGAVDAVNMGQVFGVEIGPDRALYVTEVENHRVLRVDLKRRTVRTVAGTGRDIQKDKDKAPVPAHAPDSGEAAKAPLATAIDMNEPYEVRFDRRGDMFVVEMRSAVVRKIDRRTGRVSTIAGTGVPGYGGDGGLATSAQLNQPHSIALAGKSLFIADLGNHRIREVNLTTGIITTLIGNGNTEMPASGVRVAAELPLRGPRALYVFGTTLWIALREGHSVWTVDLKTRVLQHRAGTGEQGFSGDGGPPIAATFNGPKGIVVGRKQDVYVVDTENQAIRKIDFARNVVSTVAGGGPDARGFGGDGGPATGREIKMDRPHGITLDARGNIYIGDTNNHRVRRVTR